MERNFYLLKKQKDTKENLKRNCLNCTYNKNNTCTWWFFYKKQQPKNIPSNIINKGCKFWRNLDDRLHPLLEAVIIKFNGDIVD
tara:strand:+ start:11155 stop:11406 length:252 start_codon:yes stop_codon:yes gene_type:complete